MNKLKELRKALSLKQGEFAQRISTTQGHISDIENGRKELSNRTIKLICLEFGVNEEWLRTGEGDMFKENDIDSSLAYAFGKLSTIENPDVKKALLLLTELTDEQLIYIGNMVKSLKGPAK